MNAALLEGVERGTTIFIVSMVMISTIEYVVSWILELLFDKRWWDYSDWPMNINGRISLISSLAFGALSLIQMRIIHPAVETVIYGIPEMLMPMLITISVSVIAADILLTVRDMEKNPDNERAWFVNEESELIQQTNERVAGKLQGISDKCSDMRDYIRNKRNR